MGTFPGLTGSSSRAAAARGAPATSHGAGVCWAPSSA